MTQANPEIGQRIQTGSFETNYHDQGTGEPVFLIHGSGPGVTAWANWRLVIPELAKHFRVIAPDMAGFGYTEREPHATYSMQNWVAHAINLMDALGIEQTHLVGNSFGGALAVALTVAHPERVKKLVLMGSVGVDFEMTPGLDAVWGYEPSFESMRALLDIFAYDRSLVNDELAEMRYQASIRPGFQESFSAMFPAPRQRWVDAMRSDEQAIRNIEKQTLIIHGREDQVIPLSTSLKLLELIPRSQLHVFGECGHWTQIEHTRRFNALTTDFFLEAE